jgi:hypothetical protein
VTEAPKALVLDLQTVLTQSVKTSRTSAGAERHAQSSVTSSQPEGSASPMGIRQLNMQDGADTTAGRAVMVYSGEVDVDAAALADMDIVLIEPAMSIELEVEVAATARPAKVRRLRSFMMRAAVILENSIGKDAYEA